MTLMWIDVNTLEVIDCVRQGLTSEVWSNMCVMFGKAVGLILRMCKPIFLYVKAVLFDIVLCVAMVLLHLESRGLYSSALFNKWRYCPKNVPGEEVDKKN